MVNNNNGAVATDDDDNNNNSLHYPRNKTVEAGNKHELCNRCVYLKRGLLWTLMGPIS